MYYTLKVIYTYAKNASTSQALSCSSSSFSPATYLPRSCGHKHGPQTGKATQFGSNTASTVPL